MGYCFKKYLSERVILVFFPNDLELSFLVQLPTKRSIYNPFDYFFFWGGGGDGVGWGDGGDYCVECPTTIFKVKRYLINASYNKKTKMQQPHPNQ